MTRAQRRTAVRCLFWIGVFAALLARLCGVEGSAETCVIAGLAVLAYAGLRETQR